MLYIRLYYYTYRVSVYNFINEPFSNFIRISSLNSSIQGAHKLKQYIIGEAR